MAWHLNNRPNFFLKISLLLFAYVALLFSPAAGQTELEVNPKDVLDQTVINDAKEAIEADPNACDTQQPILLEQLRNYTTKFIRQKKIWSQRNRRGERRDVIPGNYDFDDSDVPASATSGSAWVNLVRLWLYDRSLKPGFKRYIADIPPLFHLHRSLAVCYQRDNRPFNSLAQYYASFRYRPLAASDIVFSNKTLEDYLSPEGLTARTNYLEAKERLKAAEAENEAARKNLAVQRSRRAVGLASDVPQAVTRFSNAETELTAARSDLTTVTQTTLDVFAETKRRLDAKTIYDMANVIKEIENRNKDRLRIVNQKNYGSATKIDYTKNKDFVGYADLVELAYRVYPEDPLYAQKLSDEYTESQKIRKAIYFTKEYIKRQREINTGDPVAAPQSEPVIAAFLYRLGGLYTNIRRYLPATQNYEEYLQVPGSDPAQATIVNYYLADLHFRRTGNLKKAERFFLAWLGAQAQNPGPALNEDAEPDALKLTVQTFQSFKALAFIQKKKQRLIPEQTYLLSAIKQYEDVKTVKAVIKTSLEAEKKILDEMKEKLRFQTNEEDSIDYNSQVQIVQAIKSRLNNVKATQNSIDIKFVRYRLAALYEGQQNYNAAIQVYNNLLADGIAVAETSRRKKRIQKLLQF